MFDEQDFLTRGQIENLVLGLAEIVAENHMLRRENAQLKEVEKKYRKNADMQMRMAEQSQADLLSAILSGCIRIPKD